MSKAGADGSTEWLRDVDWSKTRAYCLGLPGLYLNLRGREAGGIVEPGDDAGRLEPAYVLAARVATVLKALDPAHSSATPGGPRDDSPQRVPGPGGADIVFRFTYVANIAQDPAILRAVRQVVSISPPNPDQPGGDTGNTFVVSAPAVAERP